MKYISSPANHEIKHLVNLQNRSYRYQQMQFIAEGTRACTELLKKYQPVALYMTETYYKNHTFAKYEDLIVGVADHIMKKITTTINPSGICTVFAIPEHKDLPSTGPGLVLVEISDPGNMGTLLRTAAAMNINTIFLVGCVDPYNPKVIQATAGCLTCVQIYQTTWQQIIENTDFQLCALVVQEGKNPEDLNLKNKFLVIGNEAHGLTEEQINNCQEQMTIPMPGHAESLNAAIAGAIGLYIMSKQK